MNPSRSLLPLGAALALHLSAAQTPGAGDHPAAQSTATVPAAQIFSPKRAGMPAGGSTLFGIPYAGEGGALVVAQPRRSSHSPADRSAARTATSVGRPGAAKKVVEPASTPQEPLSIDYRAALEVTPIEMILKDAVVIDGRVFRVGAAFSIELGLDTLTKQKASDGETAPIVRCVFRIKAAADGVVTLEVLPQLPDYPARDQIIRYRFSN